MRKTIIAIACCIALLLVGYAGYRGYQVWKQEHYLTMAKGYAAKADIRNEVLSLQQVLNLNPRSMEACRLMAGLSERMRSPSAVLWRQRILDMNPNSVDDRMALAQAALLFKDFATATNALARMPESAKNTANYQNIAGVVAINTGSLPEAEKHFSEAARLEPDNPTPVLNLAVVRLHSSNELDRASARIDLKRLSLTATNSSTRMQATRELAIDAIKFMDYTTALSMADELVKSTNALFGDKILRLEVLKASKSSQLQPAIARYEKEAAANIGELSEMALWLMSNRSSTAALDWLHSLPTTAQTNQPAALLIAECQMNLKDWNGMQKALEKQNWAELEFTRHALMALALRQQKLEVASAAEWQTAVQFASGQKGSIISLCRLAANWGWLNETEEILWTIVNRYPEEGWASQALQGALFKEGRTRPLMQLFNVLYQREPNNLEYKNNLAATALLLGANEINPNQKAQEVCQANPKNPAYVSTYAFSLYQQKQYAEALKVMQQLTQQQLSDPNVAGYYGLVLKANGENAKAQSYLGWSQKAALLPEEKKMFQDAMTH